jgi:hypothetical protein
MTAQHITRRAGSKQSQISPLFGIDTVEKKKKNKKVNMAVKL